MTIEEYKELYFEFPAPKAKPLWVRDFQSMIVHTRGNHSEHLIGTRRPNEDATVQKYRIDNDRAITRNAFIKAITNLQRTISHSSVEIRVPDNIKPVLESNHYDDTNFTSFIQRKLVKAMCEAANGLLVWWPEGVGDTSRSVTMKPIIVYPNQIIHYTSEILHFVSNEKSLVTFKNKEVSMGEVSYIIGKDELWKRVQYGKYVDQLFRWEAYYVNPIGEIYALPLGGDETSEHVDGEEVTYYTSFLSSAVPFADECKVQFSDHQGVMVNCSSPLREIEQIDCPNNECVNGKLRHHPSEICSTCDGKGHLPINPGPYGILVRPKRQKGLNDKDTSDIPMMRFIHPDTAILEFGSKSWRDLLSDTENALNLLFTDEAQSGIAKNIDREDKLAWLDKVAVNVYKYLYVQSVQIIYKFTFPGQDYPAVNVTLPSTFVIKSESEFIEDISKLRSQNVPEMILIESMREFISKKFGGDPTRIKMFDVQLAIDPHAVKTATEKAQLFASGAITEMELQVSNYAPGVIANYARETENFIELPIEQIAGEVLPLIEAKLTQRAQINPRIIG